MGDLHFSFIYQSPLILCYILTTNSSALSSNTSTFIITGRKRALREAYNRSLNVKHSYYCIINDELIKSYKPFLPLLQDQVYRRGGSSYIITNIEKETFQAIKDLTEAGAEIKHIDISSLRRCVIYDDNVAYFSIIEPVITCDAIENVGQTEGEDLWIGSTEPSVVQSAKKHFLLDWKNAIPAVHRINELEKGIEPEFLKVIIDPEEAAQILLKIAKSVKNEALSIMPNVQGMLRMEKLGVIDLLIEASQKGATVKIICPLTTANSHIVKRISEQGSGIRIMNGYNDAESGILIVDCEKFLQAEVKNPTADQFSKAIGFAIYSNSKRNVNSFKSFFELLWNERILNEELIRADKMQKEFINIAAHELRTPVQPVLSLSEVLSSKKGNIEEYHEYIDVIVRNAKRLRRLADDILDVTKIESQLLQLKKEGINLNEMILNVLTDYQTQIKKMNDNVKLVFVSAKDNNIFVDADRERLFRVFDNLLNNAVKFTKEGTVTITTEKKEDSKEVVISIKDTGIGIDPKLFPRLFSKFATKSHQGTGLGLFISKGIIEAHGGRVSAQNNPDGKGATVAFRLPISS
jgi:two-component system sensor histidine kinase VicK